MKAKLGLLVFTAALTACSTFSRKECEQMDWHSRGYEAASDGEPMQTRLAYFQEQCGDKHKVIPDREIFLKGHALGLTHLCTRSGGAGLGAKGGRYQGICPQEKEAEFFQGYQVGRMSYLDNRVAALESQVSSLKSDLSQKESRISDLESQLRACRR